MELVKLKNPKRFTLYIYLDPRKPGEYQYEDLCFNFEPFYVGEGVKSRMKSHVYEAINFKKTGRCWNKYKCNIINKILSLGLDPIRVRLYENITKEESLKLEVEFIKKIGRLNLKTGPLTNLNEGGVGSSDRVVSQVTRDKLSAKRKGMKFSEEWIKNLTEANRNKNYKQSIETTEKAKATKLKNGTLHQGHTQETKDKIAATNRIKGLGRKQSRETILKRIESSRRTKELNKNKQYEK